MRRAQQRKRRLLESSSICRPTGTSDEDQDAGGSNSRRRRRRSRQVTEGNSTTLMLVTVVGVFLAVELPQAVTLILLIAQYTFSLRIFSRESSAVASLVCNLVILLSYPTNFFIYCAMSRAFRTTFAELFCSAAYRRSLEKHATATDAPAVPTSRRHTTRVTNADDGATPRYIPNEIDSNAILTLTDENRQVDCLDEIEEQNETCL